MLDNLKKEKKHKRYNGTNVVPKGKVLATLIMFSNISRSMHEVIFGLKGWLIVTDLIRKDILWS